MPQPKNAEALADVMELLYNALEKIAGDGTGTKVTCPTKNQAHTYMMRMGAARSRMREQSRQIYPQDHPSYGRDGFERIAIYQQDNVLIIRNAELPATVIVEDL